MDATTTTIIPGRLVMPLQSWPTAGLHGRSHPSWKNNAEAQAALGPTLANWLYSGKLEYVAPGQRAHIIIEPGLRPQSDGEPSFAFCTPLACRSQHHTTTCFSLRPPTLPPNARRRPSAQPRSGRARLTASRSFTSEEDGTRESSSKAPTTTGAGDPATPAGDGTGTGATNMKPGTCSASAAVRARCLAGRVADPGTAAAACRGRQTRDAGAGAGATPRGLAAPTATRTTPPESRPRSSTDWRPRSSRSDWRPRSSTVQLPLALSELHLRSPTEPRLHSSTVRPRSSTERRPRPSTMQ